MREIQVELGARSYPIFIGAGLLGAGEPLAAVLDTRQVLIVTDAAVASLYLESLKASLPQREVQVHVLAAGEAAKTLASINAIITQLLKSGFNRTACLVALGGGVVGDTGGFAAACYQRGIAYIQVPTTLLAQVDSSVGGKTAVNHPVGKNMIGAFHQPAAVIADTNVLNTLPKREFSAGLAEVIKYGLIRDKDFFLWLEANIERLLALDAAALAYAIERSCINKAAVVAADEREAGQRALLNLGHTFGHAIETAMNYAGWLHGEAVGLGLLMAADLSARLGMLAEEKVVRIRDLLQRANLPTRLPEELRDTDLRALMAVDKKSRHGRLFLVLLNEIGAALVTDDFDEDVLRAMLEAYAAGAGP